jgi:hypothetical protein
MLTVLFLLLNLTGTITALHLSFVLAIVMTPLRQEQSYISPLTANVLNAVQVP